MADISNVDNYLSTPLTREEECDLFEKYIQLLQEYIEIYDKEVSIEDINFKIYVFLKGVTMIEYVYSTLFLYTKNKELTFLHTQKGIYYYIEFVTRLKRDKTTYLKMTPTDAVLFVYKKTIHNLNTEKWNTIISDENSMYFKKSIQVYTDTVSRLCTLYFKEGHLNSIMDFYEEIRKLQPSIHEKDPYFLSLYESWRDILNVLLYSETKPPPKLNKVLEFIQRPSK